MRKLFVLLLVILIFIGAGAVGIIYYIRPDPTLSLAYTPVSFKEKALEMVKRLELEVELTEEDINGLLKQALAQNTRQFPDLEVLGAQFALNGDRLGADLRLLWKDQVPAGLQVTYRLTWEPPYLKAEAESVNVKALALPAEIAPDLLIPIEEELPSLLRIDSIEFGERSIRIKLRQPDLADLKNGIGW